jgi:hypothetical protein
MVRRTRAGFAPLPVFLVLLATSAPRTAAEAASPADIEFNRDVRPILSEKCFRCHGPDSSRRKAGLRLDQPSADQSPTDELPILVPGRPEASAFYRRITADDEKERMPPRRSGQTLTPKEIELLRRWIEQGARYQPHWSLIPPHAPPYPRVRDLRWPKNPIDLFVLARLERGGIQPAAEASRTIWLRRVTFDLTGLPPTPDEVAAYLADNSPEAYEKVVDRLLASPRYGERMALDWLDAARYADTNGYFTDQERQMWLWREWLIDAFNCNKPFDQFTIEQLAGDLLPGATRAHRIATGFNRNHMVTNESGAIDEEYRVEYVADRVDTTAAVWLGLTVGCARCHDHKYDPLTQKEYYQLFGFFNNVPEQGLVKQANPAPLLAAPTLEQQALQDRLRTQHTEAQRRYDAVEPALNLALGLWEQTAEPSLPPAPTAGLIAHYDFDKHLSASAGRQADASPQGTLRYDSGLQGSALAFDGSQQAEVPVAAGPDLDAAWTVSLWVRPAGSPLSCVMSKVETERGQGFELLWKKGHFSASLVHLRGASALEVSTRQTLTADQWHHVVVRYDGSSRATGLRLIVDGAAEGESRGDSLAGPAGNRQPWRIGRRDASLGFTGRVDELRFYGRMLSEAEVASLYHGELTRSLLRTPAARRTPRQKEQLLEYYLPRHGSQETNSAWQQLRRLRRQEEELQAAIATTLVMQEMDRPRDTFVLLRGQYDKPGERVQPGVPSALPPLPAGAPPNRLGLARWLVHPDHPLTSRVAVNRAWQHFFGEGLVKTVNDFGSQGDWPSHPELLDWLAIRFVASGWDVKALHRLIVLSATYRQSSAVTPDLLRRDPENRLLARGPRFRLPAEVIRDQALAVSGLLVERVGGPSVKPYQPPGLWEAVSYNADLTYVPDRGSGLYRRSLYTYWKRQAPPPAMLCFDGPTRESCTLKRQRTNTPLQALVLLNDPTYVEAARALVCGMMRQTRDPVQRIAHGFRRAVGRAPEDDETAALLRLFLRQQEEYRGNPQAARRLLAVGEGPADRDLDAGELAAWTTVASVLLNLDEVITRP